MIEFKSFSPIRENKELIQQFDLSIEAGQIVSFVGTSGVGKTSILESIRGKCQYTGLLKITKDYFSVVQKSGQLFPWFTIEKNLKLVNKDEDEIIELSKNWKLDHLLKKMPGQVSGGQLQRFTLLRAILSRRPILLCDESLSNLDNTTAIEIAKDFKKIIKERKLCCIWITHNREESRVVSDTEIQL